MLSLRDVSFEEVGQLTRDARARTPIFNSRPEAHVKERITGKLEVIKGSHDGLVPTNAPVVIHFWIVGYPGNCTTTVGAVSLTG